MYFTCYILWITLVVNIEAFRFHRDTCIPLPECYPAVDFLLQKPFDPFTTKVLQLSYCGQHGRYPKVHCEQILVPCKTPNNKKGMCVPVKECESFISLLRTRDLSDQITKKYLREFQCDKSTDDSIQICCPYDKVELMDKNLFPEPELQQCGLQEGDDRIVGGDVAELTDFPWTALLQYQRGNKMESGCGGSLINERHVVTAAHCADPQFFNSVGYKSLDRIILGEYDIRNETDCVEFQGSKHCAPPVQAFGIEQYVLHPGWRQNRQDDIAVIRLDRKVTFNDYVKPICLPPDGLNLKGNEEFVVAGWGRTKTERVSFVKMKATLPLVDKTRCLGSLNENQICVGGKDGKDTCGGDSGGPLMLQRKVKNSYLVFLVGIVSYGPSLCGSSPSVYTFVPNYVKWINEVLSLEQTFL